MNRIQILGDWGSTRLRLHQFADGKLVKRTEGPGILGLSTKPGDVLGDLLRGWGVPEGQQVTLCGMAGARGALHEVPYAPCPVGIDEWAALAQDISVTGYTVRIAAGAASERGHGLRDLMRGEETQIFGAICHDPSLASGTHLLVLPGTHSKWAIISNSRITGFKTFLTGETFALLRGSSLLPDCTTDNELGDDEAFATGLAASADEAGLLASLFLARSAQVDAGKSVGWAAAMLSGLLIGSECRAGLASVADAAGPVHIIGGQELARRYRTAFELLGARAHVLDADACTLCGLRIIDARS